MWGSPSSFLSNELKAKVKGIPSRSYCCYGNLFCHKIDSNMLTNDWVDF